MAVERQNRGSSFDSKDQTHFTILEISLRRVRAETFVLPPITCTSGMQTWGALWVSWRFLRVHYGSKLGNSCW